MGDAYYMIRVLCPLCKTAVECTNEGPAGGSIPPHKVLVRGWARDVSNRRRPADIVYTCAPQDATVRFVL